MTGYIDKVKETVGIGTAKASETLQYGTAKASETLQYGTAKASETLQYGTAKASETLQYSTAKASETLQYGTAKASETLQYGTREIGRVANEVATKNNISSPLPSDFISEVNKAATILSSFTDKAEGGSENVIPKEVILKARGLAIFNVLKAGLVWSGRAGSGIVIARTKDESWSSPSCINIAGVGFGAQVGADVTNFVIVLNTDEAVKAFSRGENITLGGNLSVCAGPIDVGTEVSSSIYERSALYSYSNSKGFFAGVSVEGTIIMERKDTNKDFYKDDISAAEILSKKVDSSLLSTNNELYEIIKRIEGEKK